MLHNKKGKSKGHHPRKTIHFLIVAIPLFAPFCSPPSRWRTTLISKALSENLALHPEPQKEKGGRLDLLLTNLFKFFSLLSSV
jgi:hypothetical protein